MDFSFFDDSQCTCSGLINVIFVVIFSLVFASLAIYYVMMNIRHDRRIKKLLKTTTLESLFKIYLPRVYENDELEQMEKAVQWILSRCKKEDTFFKKLLENDEDESGPISNECLDSLYKKTSGKEHTLEDMLTLSKLLIKATAIRLASEVIFCSVSIAIEEFIITHQLTVKVYSDQEKCRFMRALSDGFESKFVIFVNGHAGFFTYNANDLNYAYDEANNFIKQLRTFSLSDEKKKELENTAYSDEELEKEYLRQLELDNEDNSDQEWEKEDFHD
ncbi:unnamed protein product [Caenorhabditis nigoni]